MSAQSEAFRFVLPLLAVALTLLFAAPYTSGLGYLFVQITSLLAFGLGIFVLYFFRDPERLLPADEQLILAAADGLVVSVEEMDEPDFSLGRMHRVAIFLSIFDVHINRAPASGQVKKTTYRAGRFFDARHPQASGLNECRAWWLDTPQGPVTVRQIAGLIARRIVAWSREGGTITRGERMGMIRFGSRTEIFLPLACEILVRPGDRVQGAVTPLARWPALVPTTPAGAYL